MADKTIRENRQILRRYVRFLNKYKGMKNTEKARRFFIVLHNFLGIEERCYDQCLTLDKQINVHMNLLTKPQYYSSVTAYFHKYYDPNHRIRVSIEKFDLIDEARIFMDANDEALYDRLILDSEFEELWEDTLKTI